MSFSQTRFGGNARGLPGPTVLPPISTALSRRAALFGAVTVAGLGAATAVPALGRTVPAPLAIARPIPDAALIALAGRVEGLAARLWHIDGRIGTIEDRVFVAERDRPRAPLPPKPASDVVVERHDTAAENVVITRWPRVPDPVYEEWERVRDAATAAVERRTAAHGARLGLPALERRPDRMRRRLDRWTEHLAATEAATAPGLSAKARAFMALGGGDRFNAEAELQEHPRLVLSILAAVSAETWGRA